MKLEFKELDNAIGGEAENLARAVSIVETYSGSNRGAPWRDPFAAEQLGDCDLEKLEKFLYLLSYYPSADIVKFVANCSHSPASSLRRLASYPDVEVLVAVAKNKNCPDDTLHLLSQHIVEEVRVSVASTRAPLPHTLSAEMLKDQSAYVRGALAARSDIPESQLSTLAHDNDIDVVKAAILNPRLPLDTANTLLDSAVGEGNPPGWLEVLLWEGHRYSDEEFLDKVAEAASAYYPEAWETLLAGENTPLRLLEAAAKKRSRLSAAAAAALAGNCRTPVASLDRLAKDKRVSVLESLLGNPALSVGSVSFLADSQHDRIAQLAYRNPKVAVDKITMGLAGARRSGAAANPNCPPDILLAWVREVSSSSSYPRGDFLGSLVNNAALPGEAWKVFYGSSNGNVKMAALRSPKCPGDILVHACMSSEYSTRNAASRNPSCPEEGKNAAALFAR